MPNPTIAKEIETLYFHNQYEEAIAVAEQQLKVDAQDWPVLAWKASCLYRIGDQAAGQRLIDEILVRNPGQPHALRARGVMQDLQGDLDAAIRDYNEAIRLDGKYALAYNNRGNAYYKKGDLDAAIHDYNETIRLDEKFAVAYNNRGNIHRAKGDLDAAIRDYSEAIQLDEKYALAYTNRGYAYSKKGDLDAAIRDYSEAIRLDEKYALAYYNRGVAYRKKGDMDAAIRDYNEAIRLDGKNARAYHNRGNAYDDKGDLDAAIRDYNEAIRLDEKYALAYYNRGVAYRKKGDMDAAMRDFNESIQLDEKNADAYTNRGYAYSKKGDLDAAIRDYSEAIRLDPNQEFALVNLEIAAVKRGSIESILLARSRVNSMELKKESSDDQELQFSFDRCRQMVNERVLPNLHGEQFVDYWLIMMEWGREFRPGLIHDGNSSYVHEASYGAGFLALTDRSVWIISIGDVSKKLLKGPSLLRKGIGILFRSYDFSKVEKYDRVFEFLHSDIQSLQRKDDDILLKTGSENWVISPLDPEIVFPALTLAYQGKLGGILHPPKPAEPGSSGEDAFAQIERLKKLLDMGALTQDEFDEKKKVLLGKII